MNPEAGKLPTPTDKEWTLIKKTLLNPDAFDPADFGVIYHTVANTEATCYNSALSVETLDNFKAFAQGKDIRHSLPGRASVKSKQNYSVKLMFIHKGFDEMMPLGSAFDAEIVDTGELTINGDPKIELNMKFGVCMLGNKILALGSFLPSPIAMSAEDFAIQYNAGSFPKCSVGFNTQTGVCSDCGTQNCEEHVPGTKAKGKTCLTVLGTAPGATKSDAILIEVSLLAHGAIADAGAIAAFSASPHVNCAYSDSDTGTTQVDFDVRPIHRDGTGGPPMTDFTVNQADYKKFMALEANAQANETLLKGVQEKLTAAEASITQLTEDLSSANEKLVAGEEGAEKLVALQETEAAYNVAIEGWVAAAKSSHVKAYGQCPDADLVKYDTMPPEDLTKVHETNLELFFSKTKTDVEGGGGENDNFQDFDMNYKEA